MTSILVLEESLPELQSVSIILEQAGYDLVLTVEPKRALALCEEINFDAVLCNLFLSDGGDTGPEPCLTAGVNVIAKLTSMEHCQRVIIMAPKDVEENDMIPKTLGASGIISKARSSDELVSEIRRILHKDAEIEPTAELA